MLHALKAKVINLVSKYTEEEALKRYPIYCIYEYITKHCFGIKMQLKDVVKHEMLLWCSLFQKWEQCNGYRSSDLMNVLIVTTFAYLNYNIHNALNNLQYTCNTYSNKT